MFLLFSMIWYCRIKSTAASKRQEVRWCSFRWSFPLSIGYACESITDRVISIASRSYWICNRYCQNHRRILPNFLLYVWFDTVQFNRLPCPNDKKYDDVVFVDRFHYQLTLFWNRLFIGLSRLLHAHIAYEIDNAKVIAAFCWISYWLSDLIRLHSIICLAQTTRFTMMRFSLMDSVINWLWLKFVYW